MRDLHLLWGNSYIAFEVGKYAVIVALATAIKLRRLLHWRHDGYVAHSGYVHACSTCDKLPAGAYRAGPYGMDAELPPVYARLVAEREAATPKLDDMIGKAS